MSAKSDASQGTVKAPKRPQARPVPKPASAATVKRQVQPALNAQDKKFSKARAPQKVGGKQDWRKG